MSDRILIDDAINREQDERLLALFERCGHFIYHSRGGNSGKRKILSILNKAIEIPQPQLQHILGIQPGTISESINKLVAEGLVERFVSNTDKRKNVIRITDLGRAEFRELYKDELESGYFDCLTIQETVVLEQILGKLADAWQEKADKRPSFRQNHQE